eukprot:12276-Heterococcus_DN1.PRE.2
MPVKLQLSNGRIERYAPGHVMYYGEIFLTVAGVKPCCWIAHGAYDDFPERMKEGVRTTSCAGLPNSWILANKNHPQYALVKQAFYNYNKYSVIDDALVGYALGYPATARGADAKISYMYATLAQRLRTCCITVSEYAADNEHPAFAQWLTAMQTRTS